MRDLIIPIVFVGFFGLIGFAVYYTQSATPLWALLLIPTIQVGKKGDKIE